MLLASAVLPVRAGAYDGAAEKLTLVREGEAAATIVVSRDAGSIPWFAAGELQAHVRRITGAVIPIVTVPSAGGAEARGVQILVGESRLTEELRLFVARRRLGGRSFMTNHSFYDFYDRFWERNAERPDLFEGRRPELFARGYEGRPPQLCYTSAELAAQVVKDARARLDAGADYVQLVPMDNDQQCRCAGCQALFDKGDASRQFSTGKASALFWTFANSIAREIRRTHPDKPITTIAYYDYAFPPPFDVEPNILVGPSLHTRNWWCPAMERNDLAFYKGWCAKAPGRLQCVWLYQCFPYERGDVSGFHAFPGFHAHTLSRQFRMFAADGVRGFFLCGVADYIDGYLTFRSLDDPSFDVDVALDEFFERYYGPAAGPMRELYLDIERTYTDPSSYPEAVQKAGTARDPRWRLPPGQRFHQDSDSTRTDPLNPQAPLGTSYPVHRQRLTGGRNRPESAVRFARNGWSASPESAGGDRGIDRLRDEPAPDLEESIERERVESMGTTRRRRGRIRHGEGAFREP